jgi:hypothetical protein
MFGEYMVIMGIAINIIYTDENVFFGVMRRGRGPGKNLITSKAEAARRFGSFLDGFRLEELLLAYRPERKGVTGPEIKLPVIDEIKPSVAIKT